MSDSFWAVFQVNYEFILENQAVAPEQERLPGGLHKSRILKDPDVATSLCCGFRHASFGPFHFRCYIVEACFGGGLY
jgi:hypothetical protein